MIKKTLTNTDLPFYPYDEKDKAAPKQPRFTSTDAYAVGLTVILAVLLVIMEWILWLLDYPPQPLVWTLYLLILLPYPAYRWSRLQQQIKQFNDYQKARASVLESMEKIRAHGHRVFSHVEGDGVSMDYVVVGKNGIFIVDAKILMHPVEGKARVYFDGKLIKIQDDDRSGEMIQQASEKKRWLEEMLRQNIGKHFPIRPVILFPGWYIDATKSAYGNDLWVLNTKDLPLYIQNTSEKIKEEDTVYIAYELSRYMVAG
jgi:hypothetical protein